MMWNKKKHGLATSKQILYIKFIDDFNNKY
jgi:hypothetical protein